MQEVRYPQVTIGNPHGQFGSLKRLCGRCSAFHQRARAIKLSFCLVGLRLRPLGGCLSALQCRFGAAQSFLRLAPAARIEKRHRRRRDRGDNVINSDPVADLEPYPGQPPGQRRRHHISLADARLAVLVNAGDETSFGHRCRLDRNGSRHHGPGDPGHRCHQAQNGDHATDRDTHGQSLVFRAATRSSRSIRRRTTNALAAAAARTTMAEAT